MCVLSVQERVDVACAHCGHEWLEKGYGACEGWYVCPVCGRIESRESVTVALLNQGVSLPAASVMVGRSVASVRELLAVGYHLEWFGRRLGSRWMRNPVAAGGVAVG